MLSRRGWLTFCLAAGAFSHAALALAPPGVGAAQPLAGQDQLVHESRDPVVIAAQLRAGLEFTQLALAQLQRPDAVEIFATSRRLIARAYAQVRVASTSMGFAQQSAKFKDPMLEFQHERVHEASRLIRLVLSRGLSTTSEQIPRNIEALSEAAKILRQVSTTMP